MSAPADTSRIPGPPNGSARGVPGWVWLIALLAGLFHMMPYAVKAWQTSPGYTFTGNVSVSPDYVQYRVWERQTQAEGVVVSDRFTHEPNAPFLPVPLYWAIGQLSHLSGISPEWVYAWLGLPFAIAMVLVLWFFVRRFLPPGAARRWGLGMLVFGGGLGAWLLVIERTPWLTMRYPVDLFVMQAITGPGQVRPFESFRGNYVVQALQDTHFLAYWLAGTLAVLALFRAVERPGMARFGALAVACAFATFLHVYEGMTLFALATGALGFGLLRGLSPRVALQAAVAVGVPVVACILWALSLQKHAGLPMPEWRGLQMPLVIVLLAYPVSWLLLAVGGIRYWLEASREEAMLLGWAAGCLALVLAGPFFPWPDRGTMTLQIPMVLAAAAIYFRRHATVRPVHALLLLALAAPTPAYIIVNRLDDGFAPERAHIWVSEGHQRVITALREASTPADLLIADEVTRRWLVPEYPGRLWSGHFFLTVDYATREAEVAEFLASQDTSSQRAFLRRTGATWLFVPVDRDPARFEALPGLVVVRREAVGTLFRVTGGASGEGPDVR